MAFWSSELARKKLPAEKLVQPYSEKRIKHGAYELSLGEEAYITSGGEKKKLKANDHVTIPPGQFALLHTQEQIKVPANAIALISIKAGVKLKGLVNVSGFHVDPGFEGQLMYSVYNAGSRPVTLECGAPTFLIWFCNLTDTTTHLYEGKHQGQVGISAEAVNAIQGDIASPQSLLERLQQLERKLTARIEESDQKVEKRFASLDQRTRILIAIIGLVAVVLAAMIPKWLEKTAAPASAPQAAPAQPQPSQKAP